MTVIRGPHDPRESMRTNLSLRVFLIALSFSVDKKWSGYSDEDLCRVLRDSKLYEAILTRDHVSFHRIHQAFHDANVKLPRTVLCRFLEAQGVGYSSGAKDAEATNKHKQLIEARK